MTKRRSIWIASLLITLAVAALLLARASREPSYQGKSLSEWLDEYLGQAPGPGNEVLNLSSLPDFNSRKEQAILAVRNIGTNAAPHLVRMLKARDSSLKLKALMFTEKLHILLNYPDLAYQKHQRAVAGFEILRKDVSAALPELMGLLTSEGPRNGNRAMELSFAISSIGKASIPVFRPLLTNSSPILRGESSMALGRLNPGKEVVAELVPLLRDENARVRSDTALAFSNLKSELALPSLIVNLGDTNTEVRRMSAVALGSYGKKAAAAIPALEQAVRDPDPGVSQAVGQALALIPRE